MHLFVLLLSSFTLAAEPPPVEPSAAVSAPSASGLLPAYDLVRAALVADRREDVTASSSALAVLAAGDAELAAAAERVAVAADLDAQRLAFGEVSRLLVLRLAADPAGPKVYAYRCTMFSGYAYWIQPRTGLQNPYMGTAMPACGEQVSFKSASKAAQGG